MTMRLLAAYFATTIIWLIYAALTLLSPHQNHTLQIGNVSELLVRVSILGLIWAIWLIVITGIVNLYRYMRLINAGPELQAFRLILGGLIALFGYVVSFVVLSAAVGYFLGTDGIQAAVAIKNHLPALLALVGSYLIYRGTERFKQVTPFQTMQPAGTAVTVIYFVLAGIFAWIFSVSPTDVLASNGAPVYAFSRNVLMFTLVLPYLVAWFFGVMACINAFYYAKLVKGIIYRRALHRLAVGLIASVLLSVVLQGVVLATPILRSYGLSLTLMVIYGILMLYAAGSILVALGTRRLARIEVVE